MLDNWKQFENGTVLSHNLEGHGRYVRVRRQPNLPVAHASLDIVNEGGRVDSANKFFHSDSLDMNERHREDVLSATSAQSDILYAASMIDITCSVHVSYLASDFSYHLCAYLPSITRSGS